MNKVVIKFGSLKSDNGRDITMCIDAKYYQTYTIHYTNFYDYRLSAEPITISSPLLVFGPPNFIMSWFMI